jgi:ribosomal protein S18 acetylase RimI-like enzyme
MLSIVSVQPTDLEALVAISEKTFYDAFFHMTKPSDYITYTSAAFHPDKLLSEINNPNSNFYFGMIDGKPVAYLKLNINDTQTELQEAYGLEIQRIYVLADHQGKQIGKQLIQFALEKANEEQKKYAWLGVWEKNPNAVRFYESNGFRIIGKHTFPFGEALDEDLLMRKDL